MSIIAVEPPTIETAEPVTAKAAIVSTTVFIFVEAILVAETVSVILLKEADPRNAGAVLIAGLLSMALLGNFVCGIIAARAIGFMGRSAQAKNESGPALPDWFFVVAASGATRSTVRPGADFAEVDVASADADRALSGTL